MIASLLDTVYAFAAEEKHQHALHAISDFIVDSLQASDIEVVDEILAQIDVERAGSTVCVGVAAFTRSRKDKLKNRESFSQRAIAANRESLHRGLA